MQIPPKSEWRTFSADSCAGCQALCCTSPVSCTWAELVQLGLVQPGANRTQTAQHLKDRRILRLSVPKFDLYVLETTKDGWCRYLNVKTRQCTVYERRPAVCREFPQAGTCPERRL